YPYAIACMPLTLIFIGFLLLPVIAFASVILSIVAAVKSVDGVAYRYPLTLRVV
ncbi:MAG: putative Tic20 family protein, partial [Yoonia sp.]